ncbi:hypothetical protein [Nocardiopsis sp. YSL2]|uniref:hypothetical protein n=1 Tax=Nocardiopsis sp. YSL2 TaxID=2939492 RepID=UPI0026F423C7|nr:hypothetical protein [Nocardiopsis sp. YSL2]
MPLLQRAQGHGGDPGLEQQVGGDRVRVGADRPVQGRAQAVLGGAPRSQDVERRTARGGHVVVEVDDDRPADVPGDHGQQAGRLQDGGVVRGPLRGEADRVARPVTVVAGQARQVVVFDQVGHHHQRLDAAGPQEPPDGLVVGLPVLDLLGQEPREVDRQAAGQGERLGRHVGIDDRNGRGAGEHRPAGQERGARSPFHEEGHGGIGVMGKAGER